MSVSRPSTRQRLIETAKDLFARQGITHTTTRQIAEAAGVNEVTLFRHFSTKQGLLLAVFGDLGVFSGAAQLQMRLGQGRLTYANLLEYVVTCFKALTENPELLRSVVGEAGLFSVAHHEALQQGFLHAQTQFAQYLATVSPSPMGGDPPNNGHLGQMVGTLHLLILGVAVLQVTSGLPRLTLPLEMNTSPQDPTVAAPLVWVDPLLEPIVAQWLEWIAAFWLRGSGLTPWLSPEGSEELEGSAEEEKPNNTLPEPGS